MTDALCSVCKGPVARKNPKGPWPSRCEECHPQKSQSRPCLDCGVETPRKHEKARGVLPAYCPKCKVERRRANSRARHRRRRNEDPQWKASERARLTELARKLREDPAYRDKERLRDREAKRRRAADPDLSVIDKRRRREQNLRKFYGIGLAEYDMLLARQGGGCAICGAAPTLEHLHVDHCHASGVVRGILCGPCNTGLGNFRDRSELLNRAADYIQTNAALTPPRPPTFQRSGPRPRKRVSVDGQPA